MAEQLHMRLQKKVRMLLFAYLYEHEDAKEAKNRVEQLGRRCALPYLRSGSTIINITSGSAFGGNKYLIDYSASKGATFPSPAPSL